MPFDTPGTNPLLDLAGLARFDEIEPQHIAPAVDQLLAAARTAVEQAQRALPASWEAVVQPLESATERLARAWGAVAHLNAVVDTPTLRAQYNVTLPKVTAFWTQLAHNEILYAQYKSISARSDFNALSPARRAVIEHELRDFRLGGAELAPAQKARFGQVRERQSQLATRFAENLLDATNGFALYIDEADIASRLAGVPDDAVQMFRETAAAAGRSGAKLSLHYPSYQPVLQYAHDRALREQLYHAYTTRASDLGPADWDNSAAMVEQLQLRHEQAQLLGYRNFGEVSLARKMAQQPAEVLRFLRDLTRRSRPRALRDMDELRAYAARELGLADLQASDIAYASEKLREASYAFSDLELKQYFPEPVVLAGLFRVIETLFSVAIRPDTAPLWHADARFYRIESPQGELIGQFYLDLYAREHKQGGAWQDDARSRRRLAVGVQTPVSFLTCNFTRPVGNRPALFTHNEVLTLFHEFGHGLHHLLTQVDEAAVAGIRGVEWDAVELPSQFLENFAWEWEVLQLLTAHVDTGARLPRALYDKMIAARNFQSGMHTVRQIEFALTDMLLHTELDFTLGVQRLQQLVDEVRGEVAVVLPPAYNRTLHAFGHIFAGSYAAGYYSYKWAEVLSADAFAAFEEQGAVLDPLPGARFRDEILAVGGSRPALQSFIAFRGRPPQIDALLRHSGLSA